jgi:hypothetical protein
MSYRLTVQVSDDAAKTLVSLQRSSGLNRNEAMSWILVETSAPYIPKRGKATRDETLSLSLSDEAARILNSICTLRDTNEGMVIEAYLGREY